MKNVILLTIDALRKDALGCYNNTSRATPFVDSLQENCIKFTRAQASGPYTQASFPGILTSSYYLDYGIPNRLSTKRTLISEPLKQAGIVTAAFHSNPYLCDFLGWNRGWDVFYDSMEDDVDEKAPYSRGDALNAKVDKWISAHIDRGKRKPFFLWLHYMDIHEPYVPDRNYVDMVDPAINLSQDEMYQLFQTAVLGRNVSNQKDVKLLKKLYTAHVLEVDEYIREFFDNLRKYDLLDDSVIIITSDHGDEFGEHGGLSHDAKAYSELVNVPLLIYKSEQTSDNICETVVSNIDIPPTIIHLFGLDTVSNFQGYSLLPLSDYPQKGAFGEAVTKESKQGGKLDDLYFYREKDLKIIYSASLDDWEMYDLQADPEELDNIINTSPIAADLKSKLKPRVRRWLII